MNRRYLSIILLAMATPSLMAGSLAAKPKSTAALRSKLGGVEHQIVKIREQIHIKRGQKRTVAEQLYYTQRRLATTQTKLAKNQVRLENAQQELAITVQRLERAKRQLMRRQNLLTKRVIDIYEGEDVNYLNVLLGSTDMWSFLTRAYYLKQILRADTELIDQIRKDQASIERDKIIQANRVGEIQALHVGLLSERSEIAILAEERENQIQRIENNIDLYLKQQDALMAQSRAIERQIRDFQSTSKGRRWLARRFTGSLGLPLSGRITSTFGYRRHPITGVYKLHTGIDIGAPTGTPIHASADGVVIVSGWQGAYGYAIVIDHGGGISTLYGHCSRLYVHSGASVKRGDVIAAVGSTGYATGPHCHFEKRINGSPVNPR
jgi:murein DD-endopeptidase MepM/ murein hydrolase activator NlpD